MDVNKYIPIKTIVGPGSQVDDFAEGELEYLNMPKSMDTFSHPTLPEPEEVGNASDGIKLLNTIATLLHSHPNQLQDNCISLTTLNAESLDLVNQILGVGEVSASIEINQDGACIEIQESVMAGIWRVREINNRGQLLADYAEVAKIPTVISKTAFAKARASVDANLEMQDGIINSPSILVELNEAGLAHKKGDLPLVVNLTLLPLSERDVLEIGERLGVGPVTILSRGYGNCRIGSTGCKNVWWIKYYNSDDSLILNTIEVVDMPEVAMASIEDIQDSAHRLQEILEIYQ